MKGGAWFTWRYRDRNFVFSHSDMSIKLLKASSMQNDDSANPSYGAISNHSYEETETKECCDSKRELSTSSTKLQIQPCSCVEKGLPCHCSSVNETPKKSISLETWAKYKTILFGITLGLFLIWMIIFVSLKSTNIIWRLGM